jgi:hypothetical protein
VDPEERLGQEPAQPHPGRRVVRELEGRPAVRVQGAGEGDGAGEVRLDEPDRRARREVRHDLDRDGRVGRLRVDRREGLQLLDGPGRGRPLQDLEQQRGVALDPVDGAFPGPGQKRPGVVHSSGRYSDNVHGIVPGRVTGDILTSTGWGRAAEGARHACNDPNRGRTRRNP